MKQVMIVRSDSETSFSTSIQLEASITDPHRKSSSPLQRHVREKVIYRNADINIGKVELIYLTMKLQELSSMNQLGWILKAITPITNS